MAPPLTKEQEDTLHDLYFVKKCFFGRDRLWSLSKQIDPSISRRQVADWLSKQEVSQLFRQKRTTKQIQSTVLSQPYTQFGIDLVDMQSQEYKGYKYILTMIDMFSKKAWAVPTKNKTGKTISNAFETAIPKMLKTPRSVRSDRGSEFISNEFNFMLEKHGIKQVLSSAHLPQSNGCIERFNQQLKRMMNMNRVQNDSEDWISDIQILVDNYNNSIQRVIKKTPNEAEKGTDNKEIKENITDQANKLIHLEGKPLEVDDKVRIKLGEGDTSNFSKPIYTIYQVTTPKKTYMKMYYRLCDSNGNKLKEKYYANDIIFIPSVENKVIEPNRWEISSIKPKLVNGQKYYEVRWVGYPASSNTLEPRSNLLKDAPKLVKKYEKENKDELPW